MEAIVSIAAILLAAFAFNFARTAQEDADQLRAQLRPYVCSIAVYEDGSARFEDDDVLRSECVSQRLAP